MSFAADVIGALRVNIIYWLSYASLSWLYLSDSEDPLMNFNSCFAKIHCLRRCFVRAGTAVEIL